MEFRYRTCRRTGRQHLIFALKLPADNIFGLPKNTAIRVCAVTDIIFGWLHCLRVHMSSTWEATQHLVGTTRRFSVNTTWILFVGNTGNSE